MDWEKYIRMGMELLFLGMGAWFDLKSRKLPLNFLAVFGLLGIAGSIFGKGQSLPSVVLGICVGVAFLLIGRFTKEAIGYGDGCGILILGILEGVRGMLPIVLGAFLMSGLYGIYKLVFHGALRSDTMPFFPFLFLSFIGGIFL